MAKKYNLNARIPKGAVADPVYAGAVEAIDKSEEEYAKVIADKEKEAEGVVVESKIEESVESINLDESLFEDAPITSQQLKAMKRMKTIEDNPNDVFTFVYDGILKGRHHTERQPLAISGERIDYDRYVKSFDDSNSIGIAVTSEDDADAQRIKEFAHKLNLDTYMKKINPKEVVGVEYPYAIFVDLKGIANRPAAELFDN